MPIGFSDLPSRTQASIRRQVEEYGGQLPDAGQLDELVAKHAAYSGDPDKLGRQEARSVVSSILGPNSGYELYPDRYSRSSRRPRSNNMSWGRFSGGNGYGTPTPRPSIGRSIYRSRRYTGGSGS